MKGLGLVAIALIALAMGGLFVYQHATRSEVESEVAFLDQVRTLEKSNTSSTSAGALPPKGTDAEEAPRIVLETDHFDMGLVVSEKPSSKPFRVSNLGSAPLQVHEIRTTCACTKAHLPEEPWTIAPGESASVDITVYPKRIGGFHSQKTLSFHSNDLANPAARVDVEVRIKPEFELIPRNFDFGTFEKGAVLTRSILFRQLQEEAISLEKVLLKGKKLPGDKADFQVALERRPEAQWKQPGKVEYTIHLRTSPWLPAGDFKRLASIKLDLDRFQEMRCLIRGKVEAPYTVTPAFPERVVIDSNVNDPDGGPNSAVIQCEAPAQLSALEIDETYLLVNQSSVDEGKSWRLTFSLKEGGEAGKLDWIVPFEVRMNGKSYQERIALRAYIR